MRFVDKLVFQHNLGRARYFKTEKDTAERAINQAAASGDEYTRQLASERLTYCDRELTRYLRALGQEV